jgi:hypothetical protein
VQAEPWRHFYESDLQSLYALVAPTAVFLVYLATRGRARAAGAGDAQARFVFAYAVAFAVETLVDPIATGPLAHGLGLGGAARERVLVAFVLLGDWRVLLLVLALARGPGRLPGSLGWSAALTLVVPSLAYGIDTGLRRRWPALPAQALWLAYEVLFVALAAALWSAARSRIAARRDQEARRLLRAVLAYAAAYYALWALADALILSGVDGGWLLRMLPNQLYYAFFVPFVFFAYFGGRRGGPGAIG